jgi:3-oxoacyl-[acyl-carrier-protein] synthase-1
MEQALGDTGEQVDYINAHATSTPAGDAGELGAIKQVFDNGHMPHISSTKALTGHGLGAAGANEAIFTLLMMEEDFVCASANIHKLDPEAVGIPVALTRIDNANINVAMSNSFGFGGTNATLLFKKYVS